MTITRFLDNYGETVALPTQNGDAIYAFVSVTLFLGDLTWLKIAPEFKLFENERDSHVSSPRCFLASQKVVVFV